MNTFDLSGKTAIVTGGNQGIGFAIARGLAGAGANVVIANRRVVEGQAAADTLKKEGLNAVAIPTDVSSRSSVASLVSKVINDFGKIDILVNNAGVIVRKPAEDFTDEEWDRIIDTNLKGMFLCCQLVGKEMIRRKKGKIINISSNIAERLQPSRSVYAVSKAGVSHLTRALAFEWSKHNINVNAIGPGVTITDLNKKYYEEHSEELKAFVDCIPRGRVGSTEDYVGAALFFASDAADYMVGQTLIIDGGMSLC